MQEPGEPTGATLDDNELHVEMALQRARQGRPPGQGKLMPFAGFLGTRVEAEPDITMPELAEALCIGRYWR
jgi:hypothetical protein